MSPQDPELRIPLLRALDLFRPLSPPRLQRLAEAVVTLAFSAGATIVREGDASDYFYVVVDGEVEMLRHGRVVGARGPNEYFGEGALLRGVPHDDTVVARVPSTLYALEGEDFLSAVERVSPDRGPAAAPPADPWT